MQWQKIIKVITGSGLNAPDGKRWSYRSIGEATGLSKAAVGRMALGVKADVYFTPGKKLVDLYLDINKQIEQREADSKKV